MRASPSGSRSARFINTPIRRIRSPCCARAASGHAVDFPLPFGPSRTVSGVKFFELNLSKCSEILDPEIGDSGRSSRPRYLDGRIGTLSPSPTSRRTAPCIFAFRYREVSPRSDAMKSGVLTRRPRLARPCFRCLACSPMRSMIRERVRAGLARAKGKGKRLGRPADTSQAGERHP